MNNTILDQETQAQQVIKVCDFLRKIFVRIENVTVQDFNYTEHITGVERRGKNIIAQFNIDAENRC